METLTELRNDSEIKGAKTLSDIDQVGATREDGESLPDEGWSNKSSSLAPKDEMGSIQ